MLKMNPVALKELRGRMRGARAFVVMTVFLLLVSGFAVLIYLLAASTSLYGVSTQSGRIGQSLFLGVVGLELFLITGIVPAFTSGSITGERERQTYDLLRTTLITPRALVLGKLGSALAYVLLLLLAAIPLQGVAFLFGGIGEGELILAFVILMVTAIALGSFGVYFSARSRRTQVANIATYGVAMMIMIGFPLMLLIISLVIGAFDASLFGGNQPPAVEALLTYIIGGLICTNPMATAAVTWQLLVSNHHVGYFTQVINGNNGSITISLVSPWIVYSIFYLLLSALLIRLAIGRVKRIESAARQ